MNEQEAETLNLMRKELSLLAEHAKQVDHRINEIKGCLERIVSSELDMSKMIRRLLTEAGA